MTNVSCYDAETYAYFKPSNPVSDTLGSNPPAEVGPNKLDLKNLSESELSERTHILNFTKKNTFENKVTST